MPLNESKGHMYSWVTHTHTHLGGECPHKCSYCYVDHGFMGTPRPKRYCGPLRLIENEFKVNYGSGKTIFVEHKNDLFCKDVSNFFVLKIVAHCLEWPDNTYVYQTKNPARYLEMDEFFPSGSILGCTIETNRAFPMFSFSPSPEMRMLAMEKLKARKFVTIEPVIDFDVDILAAWIDRIRPEFLNLGADSKGHKLPEPSIEKINALGIKLKEYGIELREKHNIERLKQKEIRNENSLRVVKRVAGRDGRIV